jgi:hypothetical protein
MSKSIRNIATRLSFFINRNARSFCTTRNACNIDLKQFVRSYSQTCASDAESIRYSNKDIEQLVELESGGSYVLQRWMDDDYVSSDEYTKREKREKDLANKQLEEIESQGRVGYIYSKLQ